MKVRIVEDDENIARWLRLALEDREGIRLIETTDDFSNLLTPEPWEDINTALVDLNIGQEVTGTDVLRYLKGQQPHVYRIAFTAQYPVGEIATDLADEVLEKPASAEDIYQAMVRGKRGGA